MHKMKEGPVLLKEYKNTTSVFFKKWIYMVLSVWVLQLVFKTVYYEGLRDSIWD